MKYPVAVATLVLVLFIVLAEAPAILSGEAETEKWYVYEYSAYHFRKSGGMIIDNYNVTVTFKVVRVNETAYRIELLGCKGEEFVCENIRWDHEFHIKRWGEVDRVSVITYGEDKVYKFLVTGRYHHPSTLWASIEVLEDAVKSFQILSNLPKTELSCKHYLQCEEECSNRSEREEREKCLYRCMMGYQGEVPVGVLYYAQAIALNVPRSLILYGPIPNFVLDSYCDSITGTVKFEKVEARKLSSAYVYELIYAYTVKNDEGVVVKSQSGRVKTVFSVSGWLLEGMVEYSDWWVEFNKKEEWVDRTSIKLLDTSDEAVKRDLQNTELAQPLQLGDVKYLVTAIAILVIVFIAVVLTKKLK